MPALFERLDRQKRREARVLGRFVAIYCRARHPGETVQPFTADGGMLGLGDISLCPSCTRLFTHGLAKLSQCPYSPKPSCRKCPTHCYAPGYREEMRRVMRFSGTYLLKHGRLDVLWHLLH